MNILIAIVKDFLNFLWCLVEVVGFIVAALVAVAWLHTAPPPEPPPPPPAGIHWKTVAPIEEKAFIGDDLKEFDINLMINLVRHEGWVCESVSSARLWFTAPGYSLVCDHGAHWYELAYDDRRSTGATWTITHKP